MNAFVVGRLAAVALLTLASLPAAAAGKYTLAFWRETGAYENQAPPAGEFGNHSAYVHVWDEMGQPLSGKAIYTSWGVLLGTTDANGFTEVVLNRPNGYDFQVRDGSALTETTPVLSVERAPTWGHYSFEVGFLYKQNSANPGVFDTNWNGIVNASGGDPCLNLSAPHTRSLAYYSTYASNYCSDQYGLGNWAASHGQTFVATGNRVVALKALMAVGGGAHFYWTVQVLDGGPEGPAIGPPRSTRVLTDSEYYPILVKWGINDVQVVPGHTYYYRITRSEGLNAFRVDRNNYAGGCYYENDSPYFGSELMGLVLCGNYVPPGPTGTLTGWVRDETGAPLAGAVVSVENTVLTAVSSTDGSFTVPDIAVGNYDVLASKSSYSSGLNQVTIAGGIITTSIFYLEKAPTNTGAGLMVSGPSCLQKFDALPAWDSSFDAAWGSPAAYTVAPGGEEGAGLHVSRSGPGSSVRVQRLPVRAGTSYAISVWIKCASSTSAYWAECAFKAGAASAQDFDENGTSWTMLKKFSNTGVNGNGGAWTRYSVNWNSGSSTQLSVGFKLGASSGTGPAVVWDELSAVTTLVPGLLYASANSPTSLSLIFSEPLDEPSATNLIHYRLSSGSTSLAASGALMASATNVLLSLAEPLPATDCLIEASNVLGRLQPVSLTGLNGQAGVRVPMTLLPLNETQVWKYDDTGTNRSSMWRAGFYDDSSWALGLPLFGYSKLPTPEPVRTLCLPDPDKIAFYFRTLFYCPEHLTNSTLRLRTVIDDGAVFWLNGVELFRLGMTNPITWSSRASRTVSAAAYEGPFDIQGARLLPGLNLLAVEVHQYTPVSEDIVFGASLEALVLPSQFPPTNAMLGIAIATNGIVCAWTEPRMKLESATNLFGPWAVERDASSPFSINPTNRMRFYRLRQ